MNPRSHIYDLGVEERIDSTNMARILARYKRVKGERWFVSPTNRNYQPSLAFTMQFTAKFAALASDSTCSGKHLSVCTPEKTCTY